MKIKLLLLTLMTVSLSYSQKKFKNSEIFGKYKLELNFTDVVENEENDLNIFEEILVTSITKSIDKVSSEYLNITFEFKSNNVLFVSVKTKGEDNEETEYIRWKTINNKLYIDDSTNDKINMKINDGDGYWELENNNLVRYNSEGKKENGITLVRIK